MSDDISDAKSDDWKKPLREIPHHVTTAILMVSMLFLDFAPLVVLLRLMGYVERELAEKKISVLGVSLELITTSVEVTVFLGLVVAGALKILVQAGISVWRLRK